MGDIAHRVAPNFEWHKLDKRNGRVSKAKLSAKVSTGNKDSAVSGIAPSGQSGSKVNSAKKVEVSGWSKNSDRTFKCDRQSKPTRRFPERTKRSNGRMRKSWRNSNNKSSTKER